MLNYSCTTYYFFLQAARFYLHVFVHDFYICTHEWDSSIAFWSSPPVLVSELCQPWKGAWKIFIFLMLQNGLNNGEMTWFWELNKTTQENHFKLFYKDKPVFYNYFNFSYDYCSFQVLYNFWRPNLLCIFLESHRFHLHSEFNDIKVINIFPTFEFVLYLVIFPLLIYKVIFLTLSN